jgi:chorismate synthase
MLDGRTTGAPMMAMTRNSDARSGDYQPATPRPGHADYAAWVKFGGRADHRGGGHFSGRLTAALVFAGNVAAQILEASHGVRVSSSTRSIHGRASGAGQREEILRAKAAGDSVGGIVECRASGVPAGWGRPFFASIESVVSSMMFSIPAVKGVEFGDGFAFANEYGSEASDGLYFDDDGNVRFYGNHNGGVNGGVSNGAELVIRVAIKPTPTISKPQRTINLDTGENVVHCFSGRHDPCVAPRARVVVESALAICLMEAREDV